MACKSPLILLYYYKLLISPFKFINICFIYLYASVVGAYTFTNVYLLTALTPLFLCSALLCLLLQRFFFKSILSDMSIDTLVFLFHFHLHRINFSFLHLQSMCVFSSKISLL